MKKITSILCALCVTLGAWAMPQTKAMDEAMASRPSSFQKSHTLPAKRTQFSALQAQPSKRMATPDLRRMPAVVKEDLTIDFTTPMSYSFYSSFSQWKMEAENADYRWYSWMNGDASSIVGSYQTSDFDLPTYCYLEDKANSRKIIPYEIQAEVSETEGRIDVEISMTDSLGNNYLITMFYGTPVATAQQNLIATNLRVKMESGWLFDYLSITAGDNTLGVEFTSYSVELNDVIGTFSVGENETFTGSITVDGLAVDVYSGSITVAWENNGYHVTGTVLGMNSIEYVLDLTFVLPDATRTASVSANVSLNDYIASDGMYQLYGYTADGSQYVSVVFVTTQISGRYSVSEMNDQYTYVVDLDGENYVYYDVLSADLNVVEDANGNIAVTGTMRMQNEDDPSDVVDFTINLVYTKPVPTTTENLTATVNVYDGGTAWQAYGFDANRTHYISLTCYYESQIAGTYTTSDLYADYSFTAVLGTDTVYYDIIEANVTVSVDANNVITIAGTIIVQNENDLTDVIEYNITLTGEAEEPSTGIEYDEQEADFSEVFDSYEINTTYFAQYHDLLIIAENDNNAYIGLDLTIPAATANAELVAGTYTVSESMEDFTVYPGTSENGSVYMSFAGYSDGQYLTNVWFLVSGTVVVKADGSIVVNALNSYGRSIICTLSAPTAVENVETDVKAVKRLVNGELLIERNGEVFNAQGIRK